MEPQDVSTVVYNMYNHKYVCASLKNNVWYEFKTHRWEELEGCVFLRKLIVNQVLNEYLKMIIHYNHLAEVHTDEETKCEYHNKAQSLTDVTIKMRDIDFKDKIIRECQQLFHDDQFIDKLDANPKLIGFENGVYILPTKDHRYGEFRDGRPDDYISLTTGYNYMRPRDEETITDIKTFISQLFPDYTGLKYLSSFLMSENPPEKFHIWLGAGSNGKSILLELLELALGGYASKMPISIDQNISYAASPELAKLKGVRLVSAQDGFNLGLMKQMIGGDRITCRPLFKDTFTFTPQFNVVCCCNTEPIIPRDMHRPQLVRFIDNPDPPKCEKIHEWKETFMYILLDYCTYTS
jgi:phage/plasmid-associated DNA primase